VFWLLKEKEAGVFPASLDSAASGAAFFGHHLTERARRKVEVPFDGQPEWATDRFELREHEVAPLFLHAADIAEEAEVIFLSLALGDVPRPVGIRREKLGVHDWIGHLLLGIERRQAGAQLRCQQFHLSSFCSWELKR